MAVVAFSHPEEHPGNLLRGLWLFKAPPEAPEVGGGWWTARAAWSIGAVAAGLSLLREAGQDSGAGFIVAAMAGGHPRRDPHRPTRPTYPKFNLGAGGRVERRGEDEEADGSGGGGSDLAAVKWQWPR